MTAPLVFPTDFAKQVIARGLRERRQRRVRAAAAVLVAVALAIAGGVQLGARHAPAKAAPVWAAAAWQDSRFSGAADEPHRDEVGGNSLMGGRASITE
jgi:hypothetical protein